MYKDKIERHWERWNKLSKYKVDNEKEKEEYVKHYYNFLVNSIYNDFNYIILKIKFKDDAKQNVRYMEQNEYDKLATESNW